LYILLFDKYINNLTYYNDFFMFYVKKYISKIKFVLPSGEYFGIDANVEI